MTHYAESACDACPRKCRAGIFLGHKHAASECPAKGAPAFYVTEFVENIRPSHTTAELVTAVPAGVTMLLSCETCGKMCPCLLEITGPAEKPACLLGIESTCNVAWHHVTG